MEKDIQEHLIAFIDFRKKNRKRNEETKASRRIRTRKKEKYADVRSSAWSLEPDDHY